MKRDVEISSLDTRYASYRMKNGAQEQQLLSSIAAHGIEEPLEGVDSGGQSIILNGFKRYRCAHKLNIRIVPYVSLGDDEVVGIVTLLRISNSKTLSILEQANFINELKTERKMSVAEIAHDLSRSKSWVSMRTGLFAEMTPKIRELLVSGAFPVYAYMYTLRQFMRMNEVRKDEIERFMVAVSGKGLSLREIEQLMHGYFRGPKTFRTEVLSGKLALALDRMRQVPASPEGCSDLERVLLNDLEIVQKYMLRVLGKSHDPKLQSRTFHAQAYLATAGILSRVTTFIKSIKDLNARSGQA